MKNENGDLLAHSHNIVNRWKNYFSRLLNVNIANDVRQIEVHTAEPLLLGPSRIEVEIAIAKLKYKSPGSDQIQTELIQARCETLVSEIHNLINAVWNKEELAISGSSLLLYQFIRRVVKPTVIIIVGYHCSHIHTQFF
jgi:hypothetical protein